MNGLSSNNNGDADIKNFTLLAKYIHYRKLLQSNDDKLISEINNIGVLKIDENKDLNNNSHDPNKNLNEDNNLNKNKIEDEINEIKKSNLDQLKKDKDFSSFISGNFLDSTIGKNLVAEKFKKIVDIQFQFALMEYALKNGQNPMDLFNINLDWMIEKIGENQTVKLNGKEIKLQEKNEETRLYDPEFYLKCELVFNLFYLYSKENLFDLFSVEEIGRQFGGYAEQFVKFCYNKKCGKEKNGFEILWNQLEKEFESIDKEDRRIGGFFGFLCSLIIIAVMTNIVATLSPWVLIVIPLGTLTGWLIGQVTALKSQNKILNLLDLKNSKENILLMQQTFEVFKKQYESFEPIPPGGSAINESNVQLEQAKLNASEEKIDDDVHSRCSDLSGFDVGYFRDWVK